MRLFSEYQASHPESKLTPVFLLSLDALADELVEPSHWRRAVESGMSLVDTRALYPPGWPMSPCASSATCCLEMLRWMPPVYPDTLPEGIATSW